MLNNIFTLFYLLREGGKNFLQLICIIVLTLTYIQRAYIYMLVAAAS